MIAAEFEGATFAGHVFLFVTLEKSDLEHHYQYEDGFMSPTRFHWQSQNRTKQDSKHGRLIRNHESMGERIHLFARPARKVKNKTCPFTYCGQLTFVEWQGEQPINVVWDLKTPLSLEVVANLRLNFTDISSGPTSVDQSSQKDPSNAAGPKIVEVELTDLAKKVVAGNCYHVQKERHPRFQIDDDFVTKVLSLVDQSGGTTSIKSLSLQLGMSNHRLIGAILILQRLINLDGLQIVQISRESGQVVANLELLKQEFFG